MTPLKAASEERHAIRKYLKRLETSNRKLGYFGIADFVLGLIVWINKRDDRYNLRPGGLGKTKKKK